MQEGQMMSGEQGPVLTCQKTDCSYNQDDCCYATQIQVGDDHPTCDTYTTGQIQQRAQQTAKVGSCYVTACHFNTSQNCQAAGITVADHTGHPDCFTMRPQ